MSYIVSNLNAVMLFTETLTAHLLSVTQELSRVFKYNPIHVAIILRLFLYVMVPKCIYNSFISKIILICTIYLYLIVLLLLFCFYFLVFLKTMLLLLFLKTMLKKAWWSWPFKTVLISFRKITIYKNIEKYQYFFILSILKIP